MVYIIPQGSYYRLAAFFAIPHLFLGIFSLIPIIVTGVMNGYVVWMSIVLVVYIIITGIIGMCGLCFVQNNSPPNLSQPTDSAQAGDAGLKFFNLTVGLMVVGIGIALGSIIHGGVSLASLPYYYGSSSGAVAISFGFFFIFVELISIVRAVAVVKAATAGGSAPVIPAAGQPGQPIVIGGYHPSSTGQSMAPPGMMPPYSPNPQINDDLTCSISKPL
ncbi:uncharacterized protein LOC129601070 isoform X2 [Paramacrobiotus metropolitanus]|uniref:uncharacterized protein LOC129601070 isoform X2 n=1 Tax=Paramacrobiotus metropolitanus TaxID=2943436 RepID=UPI002445C590|nr:uncharacterized protein LOC129601070 isoform X2 [Paramacrobiotus metropolitanus]